MLSNSFSFSRVRGIALFLLVAAAVFSFSVVQAEEGESAGGHGASAATFLWIAVILVIAKLASLVERIGQPSVLGELIAGVVLGNLTLLGIHIFEPLARDSIITFLAEFGVVILLFQIGLESNIGEMQRVGPRALAVAVIGVIVPFVLGTYVVGPLLLPDLSSNAHLFLGAALTATSVGITARVFQDLGKLDSKEAKIVLGAAVIDDVLGLIILAVVSALVTYGAVSLGTISWITGKAILFLIGSIVAGQLVAPHIGKFLSKINTGVGMKFTLAVSTGLFFAYLASEIGLAPIVGAFAAGLVLDAVHFRFFRDPQVIEDFRQATKGSEGKVKERVEAALEKHSHHHVEDLIEPLAYLLVPIFFIMTGFVVNLETMLNPSILLVALTITAIAFAGKIVAGLAAGNANKAIVGWGMVPRGEVGLIFATIGKGLGVVSDEVFSIIVIMVILTTLLTPPILTYLLRKKGFQQEQAPAVLAAKQPAHA